MIGIVSAAAVDLPVVVAGVPAATAAAADQAFDDVFRQLTGALLTPAAAGEATASGEAEPGAEADEADAAAADILLPLGAVVVPVMLVMTEIVPLAEPAVAAGTTADGVDGDAAGETGAAAGPQPHLRGATTGGVTTASGSALEASGAADEQPVDAAGLDRSSTGVEAHVRGLDRRRGMRETPARARTTETAGEVAIAPVAEAAAELTRPVVAPTAAAPGPTPTAATTARLRRLPDGAPPWPLRRLRRSRPRRPRQRATPTRQ